MYARLLQHLTARDPHAATISVVQDNLNPHTRAALYEAFPADEAFALAQRFTFHHTPQAASWLNMIESEFSVVARQCLDRRLPTPEPLAAELAAVVCDRQFSLETARRKLSRHYHQVHPGPGGCAET